MGNLNVTFPVVRKDNFTPGAVTDWLASDIIPDVSGGSGQVVTVHIALKTTSVPSVISYKITNAESQIFLIAFLNGVDLAAGAGLERQITLSAGDKLNFQATSAVEVAILRVDLV